MRSMCASSDVDWENDKVDRRSITGGFLTYKYMPIGWLSGNQDAVALSTAEAEYRSMTDMA